MENKERIKIIAGKTGDQLTKEEMAFVRNLSAELGIPFERRKGCNDCYTDQAKILWHEMSKDDALLSDRKFVLKEGIDVYFGSIRVNDASLTDELGKELLAKGFNKHFFAKYEE